MHLSHLRTDTQVQRKPSPNTIHLGEWGTSAPVTSMDRYASGNVERKWSKQVRDLPDKEEPRLGPYRSKKGPTQPQQGGAKRENCIRPEYQAGRTLRQCKGCDPGASGGGGKRRLCLTSCNVFEVVLLVCSESIIPAIPNGKGDRVLRFIHCSQAT